MSLRPRDGAVIVYYDRGVLSFARIDGEGQRVVGPKAIDDRVGLSVDLVAIESCHLDRGNGFVPVGL